jgi:hypothetical protein
MRIGSFEEKGGLALTFIGPTATEVAMQAGVLFVL